MIFTFTAQEKKQYTDESTQPLVTVTCKNGSLPDFKLDYDANPSAEEITALCSCLSDALMGWEKETASKLANGKQDEVSTLHMAAFPSIFGKRISECGGEKL